MDYQRILLSLESGFRPWKSKQERTGALEHRHALPWSASLSPTCFAALRSGWGSLCRLLQCLVFLYSAWRTEQNDLFFIFFIWF